ncbi:MAG TPA: Stp1/IreP family PP2C-type Ser/Thr phosphatase [Acidimicrobiales bacterium]
MIRIRSSSATDVGLVRTTNQDRALEGDGLFAVADGMGGHVGGETAAQTAIDAFRTTFAGHPSADGLADAVRQANYAVWEASRAETALRGMGTTLTALALVTVDGTDDLTIVNVGDSRAYLYQQGELSQLTADHSLVEEMVRSGELTAEEASVHPQRHILTRALGIEPDVEVDVWHVPPHVGDRILLCSDGLINELGDDEIASVLGQHPDPDDAAHALVQQARDAGGSDNITVVVVDIVDDGDGRGPAGDLVASAVGATAVQQAIEGDRVGADGAALTAARGPEPGGASSGPGAADDPNPTPTHESYVAVPGPVGTTTAAPEAPPARVRVRGRSPRVTLRVVAFFAVLLMILGGISAAVWWFGERSYFVGLQGNQVAIFKGRPGGLLWIQPSLSQRTNLTTCTIPGAAPGSTVLPSRVADLKAGKEEPSLGASQQYVANLTQEAKSLPAGAPCGPAPPPTTAPAPPAAAPTP